MLTDCVVDMMRARLCASVDGRRPVRCRRGGSTTQLYSTSPADVTFSADEPVADVASNVVDDEATS